MIFLENQDEKNIFVEGKFLRYEGSSFEDGPFEFFVVVEFGDYILIDWIKEFGEHGLFFLFFLDYASFLFWVLLLLIVGALFEEFFVGWESHFYLCFDNYNVIIKAVKYKCY